MTAKNIYEEIKWEEVEGHPDHPEYGKEAIPADLTPEQIPF